MSEATQPEELPFKEYLEEQRKMMVSPLNMWATGEDIGHSPDPNNPDDRHALEFHFIMSGGAARFAETHRPRFEQRPPT